ncbi:MAG: hypothetical protein AB7U51_01440 [Arcobacter sp.]|uniref:hypothetical protein n=1 Tax=Arcobacter sp. TaxID=1872629 RepID=UPI003CFFA1DA
MMTLLKIIITVIGIIVVSKVLISFDHSKEDFKTDYQNAQKEFNQAVDKYYKEDLNSRIVPQKQETSIDKTNSPVAKVDTKIVAQEPVNKEEKVQKDNFDRSFEEFEKEFDKKWKNF